jgi:hypothetical protein
LLAEGKEADEKIINKAETAIVANCSIMDLIIEK